MVEERERTRLGSENEEGEGEIQGSRNKWLERYSPHHRILLVGEGDFSFSSSLASAFGSAFGSASNITATSLDHYDALTKKYKKAKSNLWNLEKLGASVLLGVDATKMKYYPDLSVRKFDRIIFNFPHAGFYGKEDNVHLIEMHRTLISAFFHNASQMLRPDGEVHNYPGYHHKRGDGWKCDEPFHLGLCSTFKFRFSPGARKASTELMMHNHAIHGEYRPIYESPVRMPVKFPPSHERSVQVHGGSERIYENLVQTQEQSLPLSFGSLPSMTLVPLPRSTHLELGMNSRIEYGGTSAFNRNSMQEIPQRTFYEDEGFRSVRLPGLTSEPHHAHVERRTSVGDLNLSQGPQHRENSRRLVHSFGKAGTGSHSLLNAGNAEESRRW
ncbi:hypothetical protein BT93_F1589 [Corymbia citriodora subsp. variegata]|nr:hypothetical protein BT93_F1589 [Corymbia citriodora subsp. variegata]